MLEHFLNINHWVNSNMKRLHETNDEQIYNTERIKFSAFIYNMRSFMAVLFNFNSCEVISLLGEDLMDYIQLCDSEFTRLTMSIDNRERIQFSAFISNMCSFMAAYYFIKAKYVFIGTGLDGLFYMTLWVSLYFLEPSCINASNLCINGCYVK